MNDVNTFISRAREKSNLTNKELCLMFDVSRPTAVRYQENPNIMPLGRLKRFFDNCTEDGKTEVRTYLQENFSG